MDFKNQDEQTLQEQNPNLAKIEADESSISEVQARGDIESLGESNDYKKKLEELKKKFEEISKELLEKTAEIPSDSENSETDSGKQQVPVLSAETKQKWKQWHNKIIQCFKFFNSDILFIVTTGMLKSGKSTLVNLLARNKNVSPVGFGVDTTLRPALIISGEKKDEGIYIYFPDIVSTVEPEASANENNKEQIEENNRKQIEENNKKLEKILNRIAGIDDEDKYNGAKKLLLTDENLEKSISKSHRNNDVMDKEPLLVLVVVSEPAVPEFDDKFDVGVLNMKDCKCAIFDMPGLDSANSETDFENYNKILQKCCVALFVQSNVAPLNLVASKYIEEIKTRLDPKTYQLVQNRMLTKKWRKESIVNKDFEQQMNNGIKVFVDWLDGKIKEKDLRSSVVNLGMAYDAIFDKGSIETVYEQDQLWKDSKYSEFESLLRDSIKSDGWNKHSRQCKKQLEISFDEAKTDITNLEEDTKKKIENKIKEKNDLNKSIANIDKLSSMYHDTDFILSDLVLSNTLKANIKQKIKEIYESKIREEPLSFIKHIEEKEEAKKEEINKFLSKFKDAKVKNELIELLKNTYIDEFEFAVVQKEGEATSSYTNCLGILNKKILDLNENKNYEGISDQIQILPTKNICMKTFLPNIFLDIDSVCINIKPRLLSKKIPINKSTLDKYVESIIDNYTKKIKNELNSNNNMKHAMASILNDHLKTCLENIRRNKEKDRKNVENKLHRFQEEERALAELKQKIEQLRTEIGVLEI